MSQGNENIQGLPHLLPLGISNFQLEKAQAELVQLRHQYVSGLTRDMQQHIDEVRSPIGRHLFWWRAWLRGGRARDPRAITIRCVYECAEPRDPLPLDAAQLVDLDEVVVGGMVREKRLLVE